MPHAQIVAQHTRLLAEGCSFAEACDPDLAEGRKFDLTGRGELSAGTVNGRASLGGLARLGFRLPAWGALERLNPTGVPDVSSNARHGPLAVYEDFRRNGWIFVFAAIDGRLVGWNTTISGVPLVDGGADGWRTRREIEADHRLWESSWGISAGSGWGGLTVQLIQRSPEFRPSAQTHRFVNVGIYLRGGQIIR